MSSPKASWIAAIIRPRSWTSGFGLRTSVSYCVLMALGFFGIYLAMPIACCPQSSIEWIDLIINLVIFVPSSLIAVLSGLFAITLAVSSKQIDEKGRFKKFANMVLSSFGIPTLLLSEFVPVSPVQVALGLFKLAELCQAHGRSAAAEKLHGWALKLREKVLPPGHQDIQESRESLATFQGRR